MAVWSHAMATPWPPQRNGIADYAHEIARATEDTLLVVTQAPWPRPARADHTMLTPRGFAALPADRRPKVIYHMGNNQDHAGLVPLFLRRPGAVVLHDLSLHYLAEQVDALLPGFWAAQLRAEPPPIAALLTRLGPAGLLRDVDHREIRMLGWLRAAPTLVVHSEAARTIAQAAMPEADIRVVAHFCYLTGLSLSALEAWRDAVRDPLRARWLADLFFAGPAFVIVSLGFADGDKQLGCVIRAIGRLPAVARSQVALLVAGAPRPGEADVMALAVQYGCADRVRRLGWLDEGDADRLLLGADLVIAMRFPTRGESSGALARALGLACAAVVADHGAYAELPDDAVIKLPARFDTTEAVRTLLVDLIADRSRIVRVRHAAFAHAHARGDPAAAAAQHAKIARGET